MLISRKRPFSTLFLAFTLHTLPSTGPPPPFLHLHVARHRLTSLFPPCNLLPRLLHNYALACDGSLSPEQKKDLKSFFANELSKSSKSALSERWGLAESDLEALLARVA